MNSLRGISKKVDAVLLLVMIGLILALMLAWHYYQTRRMTGYEKDRYAAELLAFELPEKAAAILEDSISRQPYSSKSLNMRRALADIYMKELHQFEKALGELVFLRTFSPGTASETEDDIRYCLNRLGRTYDVERRKMLDSGVNPLENTVASDTVVRFGNKGVVTLEQLKERLRAMNVSDKNIEKEQLDAVVQAMARETLLKRAAEREGIDRDPAYIDAIRQIEENLKLKFYLEKYVLKDMKISDQDVADFVARNAASFTGSDRVKYSAYAFTDATSAEMFLNHKKSGSIEGGLNSESYETLADGLEVIVEQLPAEIRSLDFKAAKSIEFFGPVRIGEKYLIYQIHAFTPGEKLPAERVQAFARQSLTEKKQQELLGRKIAELAAKEEMKINEAVMEKAFFGLASETQKVD